MQGLPKRILVVDDDPAELTVISGILIKSYKVYPVTSGETALQFLEKLRPDLILLDVEMPEMSGTELFRIIRSMPELSDIPVIFLTGNTDVESEAAAFRLGVSDYIRKPISDVIMLARINMHLEYSALRDLAKDKLL